MVRERITPNARGYPLVVAGDVPVVATTFLMRQWNTSALTQPAGEEVVEPRAMTTGIAFVSTHSARSCLKQHL